MRYLVVVALFTTLSFFVGPFGTHAQTPPAVERAPEPTVDSSHVASSQAAPRSHVSAWIARSFASGSILGTIPNGRLELLGLRFTHLLIPSPAQYSASHDGPTLTYTADLIPMTRLHIPVEARPGAYFLGGTTRTTSLTTYGIGTYPIGLRLGFRFQQRLQPFIAGQAGVLYFFENVPDERGRNLNFAVGVGGGLQVTLSRQTNMIIGYRYHHLSNGFRGSINPGLDANILYLGVGTAL